MEVEIEKLERHKTSFQSLIEKCYVYYQFKL